VLVLRGSAARRRVFAPLLAVFLHAVAFPAGAQSLSPAGMEQIPLLLSDHHADHGPFMLRHLGTEPERSAGISGDGGVCMIVLDAHTDTVKNVSPPVGNHDWISPLYPVPLASLFWIYTIAGFPHRGKERGFYFSLSQWDSGDTPLNARALGLDQLSWIASSAAGQSLFISIDLDFFYRVENNSPADIPFVFDALFDFASRWPGKVVYALALSRPWLPDDEYAWELLRQSLRWFNCKTAFAPPELTLFTVQREDTSATARALRERGLAVPSFYGKENEMPADIRALLERLDHYQN
jgi:hypothetical protein